MNLLALDTSTDQAAVALSRADGTTYTAPAPAERRHGRLLVPTIAGLLDRASLSARDLAAIAVGVGPGSYTGLRIGVAAAKALAYATGADLVAFDSLDGIARNAPAETLSVRVIADAQRGDLYTAGFIRSTPGGSLVRSAPTRIESSSAWLATLSPGDHILGPGLVRLILPLPAGVVAGDPSLAYPNPLRLLDLARAAWSRGHRADVHLLEPTYLRRSAAEDAWESRMATPPGQNPRAKAHESSREPPIV